MTLILGIETSCDETAAAVVEDGRAVRSNVVASQHDLHERYGGVVPEIASRAHLEKISPVIEEALAAAEVALAEVDAVAVGNRPGLIGSLLVGVSAAKALAWAADKPLIGVDHVQAHLYAAALHPAGRPAPPPPYPALGLVVSGGHTSLYHVQSPTHMRLLGRTIDDAAGEAYDKAAVILELGYPGGPKVDQAAGQGDPAAGGRLPRSLLGRESLDFSFSGLKTALLYAVRGTPTGRGRAATFQRTAADLTPQTKLNLAAAFQEAVVDTLLTKLRRALDRLAAEGTPAQAIILGGGVSANSLLRQRALALGRKRRLPVYLPALSYCVDNAAMIAGLAHHHLRQGKVDDLSLPALATTDLA